MTKESDYDRPRSGKRLVTRRQFAALTGGAALLTAGLGQRSALAAPVQKLVLSIRDFGQQYTGPSPADQLATLADLRDRGVITADEFDREKAKVLV